MRIPKNTGTQLEPCLWAGKFLNPLLLNGLTLVYDSALGVMLKSWRSVGDIDNRCHGKTGRDLCLYVPKSVHRGEISAIITDNEHNEKPVCTVHWARSRMGTGSRTGHSTLNMTLDLEHSSMETFIHLNMPQFISTLIDCHCQVSY